MEFLEVLKRGPLTHQGAASKPHGPLPATQARIAAIEIVISRRVGHSSAPRQVDRKHRMSTA
jgi:hypothetical protein